MLYFDTSFLVPLFLQEQTSTRIEFSSLLAREVRMGGLAATAAREVDAEFETVAAASLLILLPSVEDFELSKEYLARHQSGLRAGDALHLAIARNHGSERIYSLDNTLLKAGRSLGLPMTRGL
ncbi:type II toxin-antitoxin system VapC family toxin [soil metagenome]